MVIPTEFFLFVAFFYQKVVLTGQNQFHSTTRKVRAAAWTYNTTICSLSYAMTNLIHSLLIIYSILVVNNLFQ